MCVTRNWAKGSEERRRAKLELDQAGALQFDHVYGTDIDKLALWQDLCEVVRIEPVPDTITQCRKAVAGVFVNIYDLLDHKATGKPVTLFKTRRQLTNYSRDHEKIYPKEAAKRQGLLKYLLRELFR